MLVGPRKSVKALAIAPAAVLLLVVLHFVGACSDDPHDGPGDETEVPTGKPGGRHDPLSAERSEDHNGFVSAGGYLGAEPRREA